MEIELKNFYYAQGLSLFSFAFTADLHIKGQYVGRCGNDGLGGATDIEAADAKATVPIKAMSQYFTNCAPEVTPDGSIRQPSLEGEIEKIALQMRAKQQDRHTVEDEYNFILSRFENKAILFGDPKRRIIVTTIRRHDDVPLTSTKFLPKIIEALKERILPQLQPGDRVLNRNIPPDVFKAAGLRPDQYTLPDPAKQKRDQSKGKGL